MGDLYQALVAEFHEETGINESTKDRRQEFLDRYDLLDEEVLELEDEVVDYHERFRRPQDFPAQDREDRITREARIVEELADVLIIAFGMAEKMDLDIESAFVKKMEYNLLKTGEMEENGKLVDDVPREKPDFVDCVPFNSVEFEDDSDNDMVTDGVWE